MIEIPDPVPPHHPDNFRTTYRGSRHYVDLLPACEIAEPSKDKLQAVTAIIRRAWPQTYKKTWHFADGTSSVYPLDLVRALEWLRSFPQGFGEFTDDEFSRAFLESAGADLAKAANRGSSGHDVFEALLTGRPVDADSDAAPWIASIEAVISAAGITANNVICEHVAFNRDASYAGTFDALDGDHLVDLKTRAPGAKLEPREGEIAQLGAYAACTYFVGLDGEDARRIPMPTVGRMSLLLVSPTEHAVVDVDPAEALDAWTMLLRCDDARLAGQRAARKAKRAVAVAPTGGGEPKRDAILSRFQRLDVDAKALIRQRWPWPVAASKLDDDQLGELVAMMDDVARDLGQPFTETEVATPETPVRTEPEAPRTWEAPDDGGLCDGATVDAMKQQAARLPDDVKAWCQVRRGESIAHGRGQWTQATTVRWLEVNRAIINAALVWYDKSDHDEELLRTWLAASIGDDACLQPAIALGAIFGTLTIDEARRLANDLIAVYDGARSLGFADDGRPILLAA